MTPDQPAADPQSAAPTVWIDGHPQLEAIAAAVWEACGRSDSGACVEDDPRNIAVAALAAVLPAPVDRTAEVDIARATNARSSERGGAEFKVAASSLNSGDPSGSPDEAQPAEPPVHLGGRANAELCPAEPGAPAGAAPQPKDTRPRCPHCQLPHDLTPGSLPANACQNIRQQIADAARSHAENDHSLCRRVDCAVLRQS